MITKSKPIMKYPLAFALLLFMNISCDQPLDFPPLPEGAEEEEDGGTESGSSDDGNSAQLEMLALVNEIRAEGCRCGNQNMPPVPALKWNPKLERAAKRHVDDMLEQDFFSHQGSDGSSVGQRASDAGYSWTGIAENIAYGYPDMASVIQGWKDSPGHCKNMMKASYEHLGMAGREGYWVMVLGKD